MPHRWTRIPYESNYINTLNNSQERQSFARFCTNNHDLIIEKGRHSKPKVPRGDRMCNLCNSNEIEDEIHFLFQCSRYEILLRSFLANNLNYLINPLIMTHTLTIKNKNSIHCTAKYITNCTLLRKT